MNMKQFNQNQPEPEPKLLLHLCCGPDATAVFERLRDRYHVIGYFHNPNIYPPEEHEKRSREAVKAGRELGFSVIVPGYAPAEWNEQIKGLENEPEKGRRCEICFRYNLRETARKARELSIPNFTTTLTISPHKNSKLILRLGQEAGEAFGLHFLSLDFKKKHGFRRSLELSHQLKLYRQNYCGCRYSMRKDKDA
jgi:epoxyqueuosine reductase